MDKHTVGKLVWCGLMVCCILAFYSNCKALADGEISYSRTGSFQSKMIRRQDNPARFKAFMIGSFFLNAVFFIFLILFGIVAFFWS